MKRFSLATVAVIMVLAVLVGVSWAEEMKDAHKTHQHRHLEYAKINNPVAMTAQSIAEGGKLFEKHCTACHGKTGKGGVSPELSVPRRIHGSTDGEMFHIITDGVVGTAMKGFKNELSDKMRWHLVNFITSLRKTEINE